MKSEVLYDNSDFRADSEYFSKKYLDFENFLKEKKSNKISFFAKVSDGDHSKFPENQVDEVRYLQAKDIKSHFIEDNNPVYISKDYFNKNKRSHVKEENIIMSIMGSVGDIAITPKGFKPTLANRAVAIIKDVKSINSYYLFAYLCSKFGQLQIERQKNGGVQVRINLDVLSKVKIPHIELNFQENIEKIIRQSQEKRKESKNAYFQAETILLRELDLESEVTGLNPVEITKQAVEGSNHSAIANNKSEKEGFSTPNINVKSFADSFGATGRLDAEYYQPKYDVIESKFDKFERIRIKDLVNYPISSGTTPKAGGDDYTDFENGIPFIRAVDLQNGEVSASNFNYIKPEIHSGALKRTQLKKHDVLLSIAGTVGRSAIFEHDFEGNINQAVAILRFEESKLLRLYLVLFFNSNLGQEFISKYSRQGVQTNLNLSEIGDLKIPIIDYLKQKQIAKLIEESFLLKKQSEHLLEVAKRAVEIAIEENEEVAMKYINENLQ